MSSSMRSQSRELFFILGVSEFPGCNGDGYLHEEGENEEPQSPDAKRDHQFQKVGYVFMDLTQGVRDKARDDETRSLFNPDSDDHQEAAQIEGGQPFSRRGDQE